MYLFPFLSRLKWILKSGFHSVLKNVFIPLWMNKRWGIEIQYSAKTGVTDWPHAMNPYPYFSLSSIFLKTHLFFREVKKQNEVRTLVKKLLRSDLWTPWSTFSNNLTVNSISSQSSFPPALDCLSQTAMLQAVVYLAANKSDSCFSKQYIIAQIKTFKLLCIRLLVFTPYTIWNCKMYFPLFHNEY